MLKQTAIALALFGAATAAMAGNFQVKVGASAIAPVNETQVTGLGTVEAQSEVAFTPSVEYFFGDSGVSAELLLANPVSQDVTVNGVDTVAFKHLPPTATVKYNFNNATRFTPYVGVGATVLVPWEEKIAGNGSVDVKTTVAPAAQVGFNFQPADAQNWGVFADVRYAKLAPEVVVKNANGAVAAKFDLDVDPVIYTIGYSYRF